MRPRRKEVPRSGVTDAPWPDGVPDAIENAELFLYPGDGHLFADSSVGDFDREAAALLKERVFAFLEAVG